MTLDTDILIDRRRLKRRLTFWRVFAILALVAALGLAASQSDGGLGGFALRRDHIARVTVSGFIGSSRERHELLEKLKDDKHVKAVIVAIDSPGGTTAGGEALYNDLRALAEAKPTSAVFGTAATSAAYLAGIATDHIVARGNTITGSVGVIFQLAEVSELLTKLGVKVDEIRSGPLKAKPSPFSPVDEESRKITEDLVKDSQVWFVNLVLERRKKAAPIVEEIKTGRIYTGRQALQNGLIDVIGDETTAIKWFTDERKVPTGLKVLDRKPKSSSATNLFQIAAGWAASRAGHLFGLDDELFSELETLKDRPFSGLFSIWHGQ